MTQKQKTIISIGFNFSLFGLAIFAWIMMMFLSPEGPFSAKGLTSLIYFTVLSNLFCGLTGLVSMIFQIISLVNGKEKPFVVSLFCFISTVAVTITLLVVVCFLAPKSNDYFSAFEQSLFFFHFLIPVLAIINFTFFDTEKKMKFPHLFFGLSSPFLYGIFYFLNYFLHFTKSFQTNYDWYGFLKNDNIWTIIIFLTVFTVFTTIVSMMIFFLHKLGLKLEKAEENNCK